VATSRIAEHVGRVLGNRYRLTRPLGTGASAHVYVAEDVTLRRRVAVKVLHPALADDEAFQRRFQAEARVVAALRHPSIVRVYDWGDDDGTPYLVMELLEGGSLRALMDRGHLLTPAQAARVGADAARALDYAHRRGLVHRDIKPANLLFDDEGKVSIADFGLARALAEATWTEPVGTMLGTVRYAAPEQLGGVGLDGKADVYALALVLVEAVSGKVPFAADTTLGTLMARVDRALPVPDEVGPLAAVIALAGTAQPAERADALAVAVGLEEVATRLPPPSPLPLAGPQDERSVESDPDQTEWPGQAKLFDAETVGHGARGGADNGAGPSTRASAGTALRSGPGHRSADPLPVGPRSGIGPRSGPGPGPGPGPVPGPGPGPGPRVPLPTTSRSGGRWRRGRAGDDQAGHPSRKRRWLITVVALVVIAGAIGAGGIALIGAGKPSHPVPALGHATEADAQRILAGLHFHLQVSKRSYDDNVPKDELISQAPPPNQRLREGSAVSVVVSLGLPLVTVPNLAGLSANDATNQLIGAGLKAGNISGRFDKTAPKGTVLSWSGQGGQLTKGSAVDMVVSNGPPVVTIPSLGPPQTFGGAQAALSALGLTAVEVDQFSDAVPKGQVVGTKPGGGTSITVGSQVTVTVSKGVDLVPVSNVAGLSVEAATVKLQGDGFAVTGVTGLPTRPVTRTSPAVGTQVKRGSSVGLFT
jgi:beta-lactam-binding protein with PASTA domain/tRNA A-37 threonylcarbamoyl transferase component Bud32